MATVVTLRARLARASLSIASSPSAARNTTTAVVLRTTVVKDVTRCMATAGLLVPVPALLSRHLLLPAVRLLVLSLSRSARLRTLHLPLSLLSAPPLLLA